MNNLLYKEFKLVIHPFFYLTALFGALLLIPNWVYYVALMYFLFIAIPNIFYNTKVQNDIGFSVLMPVRKSDVIKARIVSLGLLEILQIAVAAIFVAINISLYKKGNFLMDANVAYLGCVFVMYGVFNVFFFPMYYKTANKIGAPIIVALAAVFIYAGVMETLVLLVPAFTTMLDGVTSSALVRQIPVLIVGMILFVLLTYWSYRRSAANFEKIDL